ncbi:bifunctional GNAT family N-acetyltransferase/class I SAM-dependent methyltransferase [Pelomonas sp. SE-A7]|uniref:bifunctional GNAT family N-acetyltransferase/class I SAM-dependent methyltransferase n=1 Tax=Pelomonas sp. SE-A7 TaxID=3054953 RepID=UPI00259CF2AC|nr:bifunctional GNAT family N-acetyltransferase/class I SAM-dependent methyltransferase [Pelomonas sp. SE-A7]MDM4767095.1 bifunctional GNAT family N-acetyltransferase/class I SAM-dependent methyltransferase [Pelomonas sp. SE-A7]
MLADELLPRRGAGFQLRRLMASDLAAFQAYRGDAELGRYQGWQAMSDEQAAAFIAEMADLPVPNPGGWVQLAIADEEGSALLGDIGLFVDATGTEAEVGFTLSRGAQGRGLAAAAVRSVIELVFEATGVQRVRAITDARNEASIRLLERLGLRRVDSVATEFRGEPCVEHRYELGREDGNRLAVAAFDRHAARYADKYFLLPDYDAHYRRLLARMPSGGSFLDLACGPGNVSGFAVRHRPDLQVLGVDLAPQMLAQARERVPAASFVLGDCRRLELLGRRFDGAAFAFGLSYLAAADAERCLANLAAVLNPGAPLLLSTVTGSEPAERVETSASGDRMFTAWRTPEQVQALVTAAGFEIVEAELLASPANASLATQDLVLIAVRR